MVSLCHVSLGQTDSALDKAIQFPNRLFSKINRKVDQIDDGLTRQTEKYLRKLAAQEKKLERKLYKINSNAAKSIFSDAQNKYASFTSKITASGDSTSSKLSGEYLPYVDSLKGSLEFAQKYPDLVNMSSKAQKDVSVYLNEFNALHNKFSSADQIKEYVRQRKEMLKQQLMQYSGMQKYLDEYNKQVYYYSQQIREYKEALNDPDKAMEKTLYLLNKIPAFSHFMEQNGQLAALFGIPGGYGSSSGVEGLQTRDMVQQVLQGTVSAGGSGGMAALENSLSTAHEQLDQLKDKLSSLGNGSGDIDMPKFKPNNQKTKTFLNRLEFGTNIQTVRANGYFPTATDIGLSLGYKISDKGTIGVGTSFNIGWGTSIQHIHLTTQGISLRSFMDYQLKKNLYASGGFEMTYTRAFTTLAQLETFNLWQPSGLIGISKMVSLPGKVVKRTKVSVLWDFLSYYQRPQTQPILFRVGYIFK